MGLLDNIVEIKTEDDTVHRVVHEDVIKRAIAWYARYKDRPALFQVEQNDAFNTFFESAPDVHGREWLMTFNTFLFKYYIGDNE